MDELKIVIAEPFKIRGKARLTPAEFTFSLTLELKWLTPELGCNRPPAGRTPEHPAVPA
jgi:hypothetical protein